MRSAVALVFLSAVLANGALAAPISDAASAIKSAQNICRLMPLNTPGEWQARFVKNDNFGDEWHVWYGPNAKEPQCGFVGAIVKADGNHTSCTASICNTIRKAPTNQARRCTLQ